MTLEGRVWKEKKQWLIEIPALDIMTQGHSKNEALEMLRDAVKLLVHQKGFDVLIKATPHSREDQSFLVESNNDTAMLALMLKRQRAKSHLTLEDMVTRLGVKSKNAYAQYEQGRHQPSLTKIQKFLSAMNRRMVLALNVVSLKNA